MSYATAADLLQWISEAELIQVTDDLNTGEVDADRVETALESATLEIDGYLGERYQLPLAEPPGIMVKLCADIAIYNLYSLRHGPPEWRQRSYDNAVKFLTKVALGQISLGQADPDGTGTGAQVLTDGPERVFSRTKLEGF